MTMPNTQDSAEERERVRAREVRPSGAARHRRRIPTASCCGSSGCCGSTTEAWDPITSDLYDEGQKAGVPAEALLASLGCGNPTALAQLHEGETVLDLGSGGGIDVLLSAKRVGPTGKVYGLDMTDEMLALANENKRQRRRRERRVPQGRDREHSASRQLGRRHHLELRHQSLGGQGARAARSVPRPQAGRAIRGVRRRRARRGSARSASQHGAVDRLRRRRARGDGVSRSARRRRLSPRRRRADAHLQGRRRRAHFSRQRPRPRDVRRADRRQVHERVRARGETDQARRATAPTAHQVAPCCGPDCCYLNGANHDDITMRSDGGRRFARADQRSTCHRDHCCSTSSRICRRSASPKRCRDFLVAESGDRSSASWASNHAAIATRCCARRPSRRLARRGVGRQLVERIIAEAEAHGIRRAVSPHDDGGNVLPELRLSARRLATTVPSEIRATEEFQRRMSGVGDGDDAVAPAADGVIE